MESNKFNKHGKPIIGSLVQGAKTSPQLSNLCFYEIDEEIDRLCINNDCTYSRYSDDIFISSNSLDRDRAIDMIRQIRKIISMKGFRINNKKTLICPPGTKKIVTGLVVNSKNPTAKIQYIKLKNYAYYIKKYDINDACKYSGFKSVIGYKNHIYGILSYIKQFDIKRYNEYKSAFDNFSWPKI
jgi:RNA-directed DNA polymerase